MSDYEFRLDSGEVFRGCEPIIGLNHDYLWVGGTKGPCFGHLSNLRTLRAIHKRLGQIIRQRTRKRSKP